MRIQSWLFILSILLLSIGCFQSKQTVLQAENTFSDKKVRLMFYNVENLFDTENDSLTNDDEFLPDGAKYWTPFKYREKLTHIYKVFAAVGQWQGVDIAGLCEVENLKVLEDLVNTTPLKSVGYKILHKNSTDPRGIDVAILYNPATVKVLYYNAVPVLYPESSGRGRDILHAVFTTPGNDTLHFYVNHWPSRFSGHIETEEKRLAAALTLKRHSDSVMLAQPGAKIVITGDFNDHPTDGSFVYGLQTINTFDNPIGNKLYNVSIINVFIVLLRRRFLLRTIPKQRQILN